MTNAKKNIECPFLATMRDRMCTIPTEKIDDMRKKVMPYLTTKYDEATTEERDELIGNLMLLFLAENGYCGTKDAKDGCHPSAECDDYYAYTGDEE